MDDGHLGAATISDSGAEVDIVPLEVAKQLVAANVVGPIQALPAGEQMVITFGKAGSKEAVVGFIEGNGLLERVYVLKNVSFGLISDFNLTEKGVWVVRNHDSVWGLYGGIVVMRGWRDGRLWHLDIAALLRAPDPRVAGQQKERADDEAVASVLEVLEKGDFGGGHGAAVGSVAGGVTAQSSSAVAGAARAYSKAHIKVCKGMVDSLGHISALTLAKAVEGGTMRNLPVGASAAALRAMADRERGADIAYLLGHERKPHELGSGIKATIVGQEISFDDIGPYTQSTWGATRALVCMCTYSGWTSVYALADKKALADCVKLVCQFYGFHGHKVERLRCDMTTLVGKDSGWKARMEESDVRAVCADLHLTLSQAGAEMQQQNPVERMIGTLGRDLSTVLLTQHMFAKKHWLLGFKYVATIRNCLPTEAHPLTSPMELVMKVAPDFEHIAVAAFGQPVIVPRVGANGIGDTNWEPAAMVAPLLEGGKLHAVMFEGESKPTIRGGVKAVNRPHLEITAQDRKALETKLDDRGRVVEFHSAAKKDWSISGLLRAYDDADPNLQDHRGARFEGWTGKMEKGGEMSEGNARRLSRRVRTGASTELDEGDLPLAPGGADVHDPVLAAEVIPASDTWGGASADDEGAAPGEVIVDGFVQYWTAGLGQVGRPSSFNRELLESFEQQHGRWPTETEWQQLVIKYASDEECVLLEDFQVCHGGRAPTAQEWEAQLLTYASAGQTLVPREQRTCFKAAQHVQRTDANPSLHQVERSERLQALWQKAVGSEVTGAVADGSAKFISDEEVISGGYKEIWHVTIFKTKRNGDQHVRMVLRGDRESDEIFADDSLFAPTLHGDTLLWAVAFGAYYRMRFSSSDVSRCFRRHNNMASPHCKTPRNLYTRISAFESQTGRPENLALTTITYGLKDAPRLWHDISTDTLLQIKGMRRSQNDPCLFYMLRGATGLMLLLKIVDDILEIVTPCDDGQAMLREFRHIVTDPAGEHRWTLTYQDPVEDYNSLAFAFTKVDGVPAVILTQPAQCEKVREHFFGTDTPPVTLMPFPKNWSMMRSAQSLDRADSDAFMQGLGVLGWLRLTKNYSAAMAYLASQAQNPAREDWEALVHLAAHMWTTRDLGLAFLAGPEGANIRTCSEVYGYADGAEGQHLDGAGQIGEAFFMGPVGHPGGAIKSRSVKQSTPYDDSIPAKELAGTVGASKSACAYRALAEEVTGHVLDDTLDDVIGISPPATAMHVSEDLAGRLAGSDNRAPLRDPMRAEAARMLGIDTAQRAPATVIHTDSQAVVQTTTTLTGKSKGLVRLARKLQYVRSLHDKSIVGVTKVVREDQHADNLTKVPTVALEYWRGVAALAGPQPALTSLLALVTDTNQRRKQQYLTSKRGAQGAVAEDAMDIDDTAVATEDGEGESEAYAGLGRFVTAMHRVPLLRAATAGIIDEGADDDATIEWLRHSNGRALTMLRGKMGGYSGRLTAPHLPGQGRPSTGPAKTAPVGQVGEVRRAGLGLCTQDQLREQLRAQHDAQQACHSQQTGLGALVAYAMAAVGLGVQAGPSAEVDCADEMYALTFGIDEASADQVEATAAQAAEVAEQRRDGGAAKQLAALTQINTAVNANADGAAQYFALIRAGEGYLILRRQAVNSTDLQFIDTVQHDLIRRQEEAVVAATQLSVRAGRCVKTSTDAKPHGAPGKKGRRRGNAGRGHVIKRKKWGQR